MQSPVNKRDAAGRTTMRAAPTRPMMAFLALAIRAEGATATRLALNRGTLASRWWHCCVSSRPGAPRREWSPVGRFSRPAPLEIQRSRFF